jgi:hypothetical protein
MKYNKPELKSFDNIPIYAECNLVGSGAGVLAGCGAGGGASNVTNCENGSNAQNPPSSCYNTGTQPTTSCNDGTTVGNQCITGELAG